MAQGKTVRLSIRITEEESKMLEALKLSANNGLPNGSITDALVIRTLIIEASAKRRTLTKGKKK